MAQVSASPDLFYLPVPFRVLFLRALVFLQVYENNLMPTSSGGMSSRVFASSDRLVGYGVLTSNGLIVTLFDLCVNTYIHSWIKIINIMLHCLICVMHLSHVWSL